MIRIARIRTFFAALLLGSALAVPGLQLAQTAAPQLVHAASAPAVGPVLAGNWVNYSKGARFQNLQIQAVSVGGVDGGLPTAIIYGVNVFSVSLNRFVAFGKSPAIPYAAAATARIPLRALPTPSHLVSTTITVTLLNRSTIRVLISDSSPFKGQRTSTEIMYLPS